MAPLFGPRQLGVVGIRGGCEAAVHSALAATFKVCLLTILWSNSILPTRSTIYIGLTCCCQLETATRVVCLLPLFVLTAVILVFWIACHFVPGRPKQYSVINTAKAIPSRTAPFLFHHSSSHYFAELRPYVGNLDDLTLAGPQSVVAVDIQQVMAEGSKMGLRLNPSKCEVISHPDPNIVDQTMSSFTVVSVADTTLLGAPLFPGKVLDDTWLARCEDLKRAVDRLSLPSAEDALLLMRVSFSAPRVQHLLRCSPLVDNQSRP